MQPSDYLVPARYYARIAELFASDGLDLTALLESVGLSMPALARPEAQIRVSDVDRLLVRAAEISSRSDLGFELGKRLSASSHSFVGFGMLNSRNLDQALRFEAQYFGLIMPSFRMRYANDGETGEVRLTPRIAMSHVSLAFHLEAIGMAAIREIDDLTGHRRPPCRLRLSIMPPPHVRLYDRIPNLRYEFGADLGATPGVSLTLLGNPSEFPLAMADPHARAVAESRCQAMLDQVTRARAFADWVAMTLREVSGALPTLDELAATLNISPRTLNRYLAREGTTFRTLAGKIQHDLACERLAGQTQSVTEVAYSLGFSDSSNFARAFRAREGCSPLTYQRRANSPMEVATRI